MTQRDKLIELLENMQLPRMVKNPYASVADYLISNGVTVLPCRIGDEAWIIRGGKYRPIAKWGRVSQMFYIDSVDGMELEIVVRCVGRGRWGKEVFATREEAEAALKGGGEE